MNKNYDYVLWIDADAFFCNFDIKIEDWIQNDKNFIVCRDAGANLNQWSRYKYLINSGVMIFKNVGWSKNMLHYILHTNNFLTSPGAGRCGLHGRSL